MLFLSAWRLIVLVIVTQTAGIVVVVVYKYIVVTLHIDTLILPAMILKIVSYHDFPLRAAWVSHSLLGGSRSFEGKIMAGDNFQN